MSEEGPGPLLAFYGFPAEHWKHLRTSNPIESTFATVRYRTTRSKGCLSNRTALAMVLKLVEGAQKTWRRLDGHNQLPKIIRVKFLTGARSSPSPATFNPKPPPPDPFRPSPKIGDSSSVHGCLNDPLLLCGLVSWSGGPRRNAIGRE